MNYIKFNRDAITFVRRMPADETKDKKAYCFLTIALNDRMSISVFGSSIYLDKRYFNFSSILDLSRDFQVYDRKSKETFDFKGDVFFKELLEDAKIEDFKKRRFPKVFAYVSKRKTGSSDFTYSKKVDVVETDDSERKSWFDNQTEKEESE